MTPVDLGPYPLDSVADLDHPSGLPSWFSEQLTALRRHLHQHPEVGHNEYETAAFIRDVLTRSGLQAHPIAGTGTYVDIEGTGPGPVIAYRADIDALPTPDAKLVPYASQRNGVAHLCGHDAHTTVGLGVALLLHRFRESFPGTVRVFFQPNEEGTPGGAIDMIAGGVLEGVTAAYAIHVDPTIATGRYGLIAGAATASTDQFRVRIDSGTTGHSARPHDTHDTLWIASQIMRTFYELPGRITDARNPAVLTVCRFHGGDAFNVIPATAEFGGTLRTTSAQDRAFLLRKMRDVVEHVAALHDVTAELDVHHGAPAVMNDHRLVAHLETVILEAVGAEAIFLIPKPSMGAEDFAHYLEHVPGALVRVGTSSGPATSYPLHDAKFDLDERALAPAALVMARALTEHLRRGILSGGSAS